MNIKVLFIPCDPAEPMEVREVASNFEALQALIGGNLEVVGLKDPGGRLWVDEDGKLKRLRLNQRATALVQRHAPMVGGFIVGDAFVSGVPTRDGRDTPVDDYYAGMVD